MIRPVDTKVATLPYDCIGRARTEDEVMLDGSKVWKVATDRQVHGGRRHHLTCSFPVMMIIQSWKGVSR